MEGASETQDLCLEVTFLPESFYCHQWKGQWEQAVAVLMFPKLVSVVLPGCGGVLLRLWLLLALGGTGGKGYSTSNAYRLNSGL